MAYAARQPRLLTADEFLVHQAAGESSELVRGEIRMMSPASGLHGLVAGNIWSREDATGNRLMTLPRSSLVIVGNVEPRMPSRVVVRH